MNDVVLRRDPRPDDPQRVRQLVAATGFFSPEEEDIAAELVGEHLAKGEASGYFFVFAESGSALAGYSCFGPTPATEGTFDLYWIAVSPEQQRSGIGRRLLAASEEAIRSAGGRLVFLDTSTRPQYAATRAFYERCDYQRAATLDDFYRPGDGKAIYSKRLARGEAPPRSPVI